MRKSEYSENNESEKIDLVNRVKDFLQKNDGILTVFITVWFVDKNLKLFSC